MTDELELLKKDWQKKEFDVPKLSYEDIHKMIWKRSSSIVKWILIISILEFAIPQLLYLFPSMQESMEIYENIGISQYFLGISIIYYGVVIYFIYQFYLRFKEISVLDNSKNLMRKIIKTRRTVKHYVIFSLIIAVVTILTMILGIYLNTDILHAFPEMNEKLRDISPQKLKVTLMISIGIFGLIFIALLGLFYFLVYGLLIRKLKKNYSELRQLEF
jgi:nitrate reductase NapE component